MRRLTVPVRARAAALLVAAAAMPARAVAQDPAADSMRTRIFPIPFLFYQPETKLGGGVGLLTTYRTAPGTRASSANAFVAFTQRRQFTVIVQSERFTPGDRWRLGGEAAFSRFPDLFYGVGNATNKIDEEDVTLQHLRALVDVRRAIGPGAYLGVTGGFQHTRRREVDSGGIIEADTLAGSRGGTIAAFGVVGAHDRRDNSFATRRGTYGAVTIRRAARALGGDFAYTRADLDLRGFMTRGRHTVAGQLLASATDGAAPFYDLAVLGGSNVLRGYYEGRFRDRQRLVAQAEWRFPVYRRVSGVAFAGAGQVMRTWGDMRADGLHGAWGGGVRFLLSPEERVNLRIDFGMGRGEGGVYFALSEAF